MTLLAGQPMHVSDGKHRMATWPAVHTVAAALAAATLAVLLAAGCTSRRSVAEAGRRVLASIDGRPAPASAAETPAMSSQPDRFARLPKRPAPASAASEAPASGAAAPTATAADPFPSPATSTAQAALPGAGPAQPQHAGRLAGFVDPLTKSADRVPIDLEGCLRRALANNLSIQIARFGPAIAATAVVEAEALFDPSWFMNNALNRIRRQSGSFLTGATTLVARQWDFATGIDTRLPTGATVQLAQDWTFLETNSQFFSPNPQHDADLSLVVRQPLLRGAGVDVNRSPIVLARMDRTISLAEFKARVMDVLLAVEKAYWDLAVAEARVRAISESLEAARENLRIARRRFQEGRDRRVIVSLAESAVTSREADLVVARFRLTQASDQLKRLLHDPDLPLQEPAVLEAMESPLAEPIPVGPELLQSSMLAAMKSRPEIEQAESRLAQAGVREKVARNDRLPQLDLAAGYTLNGLEGNLDRAIDREFTTEFFDWSAGLEFRLPIGNRARRAAHERSRLEQSRAIYEREEITQRVLLEVSDAVRSLASAEEAILATRAARQAAEQSLRDQQANVDAGAALLKDLLDAQRDLADAKVRETEAMASYMTSLAALERAKGTLLQYNNITIIDEDEKGGMPAAHTPPADRPHAK